MVRRVAVLLHTAIMLLMLVLQTSCSTTSTQEAWATVRVTKGDTLQAIAKHYRISVSEIADANDIDSDDPIYPGQILAVPLNQAYARSRLASRSGIAFGDAAARLIWPVQGQVSSDYGPRGWRDHEGIDIRAPKDTKIQAAHDGVITFAGWKRGYGQTVIVEQRNFRTLYAHCNRVMRRKGDVVERGEIIATVGKTGNASGYHLHFEYRDWSGRPLNPLDFLPSSGPPLISRR